jgi:hypothetical protein
LDFAHILEQANASCVQVLGIWVFALSEELFTDLADLTIESNLLLPGCLTVTHKIPFDIGHTYFHINVGANTIPNLFPLSFVPYLVQVDRVVHPFMRLNTEFEEAYFTLAHASKSMSQEVVILSVTHDKLVHNSPSFI